MRLVYITANFPYGVGEAYFGGELAELVRQGWDVLVVPRSTRGLASGNNRQQGWQARPGSLVSWEIAVRAFGRFARSPRRVCAVLALLRGDRRHLLRNLAVVPKALWLSGVAERWGADHIHAHWASTTATMAMIAAQLAGISWSFTAHRWDIDDGNLTSTKVERASFVRAISQAGLRSLRDQAREGDRSKIHVIHMGVSIPDSPPQWIGTGHHAGSSTLLCAGNLNEGKGHDHLLDALSYLKTEKGLDDIVLLIAGEGPLMKVLRRKVRTLGISEQTRFLGHLPNHQLLSLYESGAVDVSILASSFEGIPVALMEAMSYGIPVIATAVGGVPELCGGDCGVLIPAEDSRALAEAVESLLGDRVRMQQVGISGRRRVVEEFSLESTTKELSSRMTAAYSATRP